MRTYGQYCGVARAANVLTERWAMLIVRDLLVGPLRFSELKSGLDAPSNMVTTRLKELEEAGVVERVVADKGMRYQLTPYGRSLEPIIDALGRWGARRMDVRLADETISDHSLASALRGGWTGEATRRTVWQVEAGTARCWGITDPAGSFELGSGLAPESPTVTISGPGLRHMLAGVLAPREAIRSKRLTVISDEDPVRLLEEFQRCFDVPLDVVSSP